jgi:hypothetical protein
MAIVYTGKPLTSSAELLPSWTVTYDGFGLVTSTTRFKSDWSFNTESIGARGTAHPDSTYSFLKAARHSTSWDNNRIALTTVDYVGIDPGVGGGAVTIANCSTANGLTAENITTHPNFFEKAGGFDVGPIAGLPTDFAGNYYPDSTKGPPVSVISQEVGPNLGKPVVVPSCEGYNGACFESGKGGRFIGFVDPTYKPFYGKTQYLAPSTTISGIIYVTNISYVQAMMGLLGTASATRSWGILQLLPAWASVGSGPFGKVNLLSQVNVEEYGALYKILYEVRYNKEGWTPDVYANI